MFSKSVTAPEMMLGKLIRMMQKVVISSVIPATVLCFDWYKIVPVTYYCANAFI